MKIGPLVSEMWSGYWRGGGGRGASIGPHQLGLQKCCNCEVAVFHVATLHVDILEYHVLKISAVGGHLILHRVHLFPVHDMALVRHGSFCSPFALNGLHCSLCTPYVPLGPRCAAAWRAYSSRAKMPHPGAIGPGAFSAGSR